MNISFTESYLVTFRCKVKYSGARRQLKCSCLRTFVPPPPECWTCPRMPVVNGFISSTTLFKTLWLSRDLSNFYQNVCKFTLLSCQNVFNRCNSDLTACKIQMYLAMPPKDERLKLTFSATFTRDFLRHSYAFITVSLVGGANHVIERVQEYGEKNRRMKLLQADTQNYQMNAGESCLDCFGCLYKMYSYQ